MPISSKIAPGLEEVDVVICGGGVTGCVVAGRLAEADPELSILLIEKGPNNEGVATVEQPALYPLNYLPTSTTANFYTSKMSDAMAGREYTMLSGGALGGGGSINVMLYSRPMIDDFDSFNVPGWSTKDMMPFLKKLETYHGNGDRTYHGTKGPLQITQGPGSALAADDMLSAIARRGLNVTKNLQDTSGELGWEYACRTITQDGKRADPASAYVHPLLKDGKHPNLHVLCDSQVIKVLFNDEHRAAGVEYMPNPDFGFFRASESSTPPKITIKARKQVILAANSFGSPLILQRSGVGDRDVLTKAGVDCTIDLPGVGANYQDHPLVGQSYKTNLPAEHTLDAYWGQRISAEEASKKGITGWNGCDIHGKFRPSDDEVKVLGPDMEEAWRRDFANKPGKNLMFHAVLTGFSGDPTLVVPGQYYSSAVSTAYGYSRGHVYITGPSTLDAPDFDCGFFSDEKDLDLKSAMFGYKAVREIHRRTKMYRGEVEISHPKFSPSSQAAIRTYDEPLIGHDGKNEVKDIVYTPEDDEVLIQFLRERVVTTWHSLGTCAMKPREKGGVVDERLNVHGTKGLKVVDLSIAPENFGGNTQIPSYAIGEKAAEILMEDLQIGGRELPN